MTESYSRWNLTIFKPWRESVDNLKFPYATFAEAFLNFYENDQFPGKKRAELLRARLRLNAVDIDDGGDIAIGDNDTPTENRNNPVLEAAANEADNLVFKRENNEMEGLAEDYFNRLDPRDDGRDWSTTYDIGHTTWLTETASKFYNDVTDSIINNNDPNDLQLFEEIVYRPENAKEDAQKFLIYQHIYGHYCLKKHKISLETETPLPCPPSIFCFIEGKPGTRKTFVLLTMRNITRLLHGRNSADLASAPTGCAAALIGGSTHCRSCSIPTSAKFQNPPTDIVTTDANRLRALKTTMCQVVSRFMDEHSMSGRAFWAWLRHRHEELRRQRQVLEGAGNDLYL